MNYFLFDSFENIKNIKTSNSFLSENVIFLSVMINGNITRKIYEINALINYYYFIKVENRTQNSKPIGILFPKNMVDDPNDFKNQILHEILNSPYEDIIKNLRINKNNNFELEEINIFQNNKDYFNIAYNIKLISSNNPDFFRGKSNNVNKNINNYNNRDNSNLITQLNYQINALKEENSKLKQELNNVKNNNFNYIKEINEYKTKLNQCINQINNLKSMIKDLSNKNHESKNNILQNNKQFNKSGNYDNSIYELINHIDLFKKKLGFDLDKNDNLMIVNISSADQRTFNHSFICKNTLQFSILENMMYNIYPKYREYCNRLYFSIKGRQVNRSKTLAENGIKNMDVITLSVKN